MSLNHIIMNEIFGARTKRSKFKPSAALIKYREDRHRLDDRVYDIEETKHIEKETANGWDE